MTTMLLPNYERRVVEAALRFANLTRLSAARTEQCFAGVINVHTAGASKSAAVLHVETYLAPIQSQLRAWLAFVIGQPAKRGALANEIAKIVNEWEEQVRSRVWFDPKGPRLRQEFEADSLDGACALAVAIILDERYGLTKLLNLCAWSKCQTFTLDFEPKGRPRRFCNAEHARRFNNENAKRRIAQYRKRKEKQS